MSDAPVKVAAATQVRYPWRASLRTGGVTLLVTLPVLGVVVPEMIDAFLHEYGARWSVPVWLRMSLLAISGAAAMLATLANKLMLYPVVNRWLTRRNAGPTPKP